MNPITSSPTFISLSATSSAFLLTMINIMECWKWFLHVSFTLLPAWGLSQFVLEEYYHLPVFVPLSSHEEFPARSNLVACHERIQKYKRSKCCQTSDPWSGQTNKSRNVSLVFCVISVKQFWENTTQKHLRLFIKRHFFTHLCPTLYRWKA